MVFYIHIFIRKSHLSKLQINLNLMFTLSLIYSEEFSSGLTKVVQISVISRSMIIVKSPFFSELSSLSNSSYCFDLLRLNGLLSAFLHYIRNFKFENIKRLLIQYKPFIYSEIISQYIYMLTLFLSLLIDSPSIAIRSIGVRKKIQPSALPEYLNKLPNTSHKKNCIIVSNASIITCFHSSTGLGFSANG